MTLDGWLYGAVVIGFVFALFVAGYALWVLSMALWRNSPFDKDEWR